MDEQRSTRYYPPQLAPWQDFESSCIHGPKALPDTKTNFQSMLQAMKSDVHLTWPGENAESTLQVSKRGQAAMDTLMEQHSDETHLAVVAHGRFNKILLATLLWNDPSRYVEIEQGNTCINVIDYNEQIESWNPIVLNYFEHAPNADAKKVLNQLAAEKQQQAAAAEARTQQ